MRQKVWKGLSLLIVCTLLVGLIMPASVDAAQKKGRKIVPFCTSGGSGISGSISEVKEAAKGAKVVSGKDLTALSYKTVEKWVKKKL